jgi:nucleoside phosphorylase
MSAGRRPLRDNAVDIAVVCTLDLEAEPFIRRLKRARRVTGNQFTIATGLVGDRRWAVMQRRVGKGLAGALDALISVHRPRCVVAAGFALSLSERFSVGDVLFASEVVAADEPQVLITISLEGLAKCATQVATGRVVSIRSLPKLVNEKRDLASRTGAIAADQTTAPLALACRDHGTRFIAARVMAEGSSANAEVGSRIALHPSRSFRVGGLVGALLSTSGRAGKIMELRERGRALAERLAKSLTPLLESYDVC